MTNGKPSPLKSRKFIAYLLAEGSWKLILLATLWMSKDVLLARTDVDGVGIGMWWFMWTIVLVAGFVETGFILGQAALDKYVRVAQIVANGKSPKSTNEETIAPEE